MKDFEVDQLVPYEQRYEAIRDALADMVSVKKWLKDAHLSVLPCQRRVLQNAVITHCYSSDQTIFRALYESGRRIFVFDSHDIETVVHKLLSGARCRKRDLKEGLQRVSLGTDWDRHPSCGTADDYWLRHRHMIAKGRRNRAYRKLCDYDMRTTPRCHLVELSMDTCNMEWRGLHLWSALETAVGTEWCRG